MSISFGFYDSVLQRRLSVPPNDNFVLGKLRWDLLTSKELVFRDTQVFDGPIFIGNQNGDDLAQRVLASIDALSETGVQVFAPTDNSSLIATNWVENSSHHLPFSFSAVADVGLRNEIGKELAAREIKSDQEIIQIIQAHCPSTGEMISSGWARLKESSAIRLRQINYGFGAADISVTIDRVRHYLLKWSKSMPAHPSLACLRVAEILSKWKASRIDRRDYMNVRSEIDLLLARYSREASLSNRRQNQILQIWRVVDEVFEAGKRQAAQSHGVNYVPHRVIPQAVQAMPGLNTDLAYQMASGMQSVPESIFELLGELPLEQVCEIRTKKQDAISQWRDSRNLQALQEIAEECTSAMSPSPKKHLQLSDVMTMIGKNPIPIGVSIGVSLSGAPSWIQNFCWALFGISALGEEAQGQIRKRWAGKLSRATVEIEFDQG